MKCPECPIRWFAVVVAVIASLLVSSSAFAATSANGSAVSDARAEGRRANAAESPGVDELRQRLADVVDDYKRNEDKLGLLEKRSRTVGKQIAATKSRLARARERVARIAQIAYVNGGIDNSATALLGDGGPAEVAQRMTTMAVLSTSDDIALRDAERERRRLNGQLADLNGVKKDAASEQAKLKVKRAKLNAALQEAAERAAAKRAAAKREAAKRAAKRTADRSSRVRPTGQFVCPVGSPYTMMNTFGAPRGGGRSHEGVDIAAPRSTPLYAVEDATVSRAYSNTLGGIALILKGKSGDSYYYAHQEVNLVSTGQRVQAGQLVARVGMTGDAQGTIYHLHFERWPNGGNAVDPWPFLYPLCGKSG